MLLLVPQVSQVSTPLAVQSQVSYQVSAHRVVLSSTFVEPYKPPDYTKSVLAPLHAHQQLLVIQEAERAREQALAASIALQQQQEAAQAAAQAQVVQSSPQVSTGPQNCSTWLTEAGVTDVSDAMIVINRESGCNPYAREPSTGACGIAQELPCGKSGCMLGDPVCEIRWMQNYCVERYGSWAGAVAHEQNYGWY